MERKAPDTIRLAHGAGGTLQTELIELITETIQRKHLPGGIGIEAFDDGGTIPLEGTSLDIVLTADGHTVFPLEFPGGDLGLLSVAGTVNDLLMMGARPVALTSVVLLEEGLKFERVQRVMATFNETLNEHELALVAGDTKVMPKGSLQEMVIVTTGFGVKPRDRRILDANVQVGDKVILTGSIGDHGVALMSFREGVHFETKLRSDVAVLAPLLMPVLDRHGTHVHAMKDPTRGGLAAALNEWSKKSNVSIWLEEEDIPIKPEVTAACEMLGLEPFEVASEGRAILAVEPGRADAVLDLLRQHPLGSDARVVGEVRKDHPKAVFMKTVVGGTRFIDEPQGALIPRIC